MITPQNVTPSDIQLTDRSDFNNKANEIQLKRRDFMKRLNDWKATRLRSPQSVQHAADTIFRNHIFADASCQTGDVPRIISSSEVAEFRLACPRISDVLHIC
jgi:hypothetical protein